ncbi:gamma-glutamyl-gamma-aminobutyrate hydrolase family protein [Agrococcus sp. Marseille-Q4369]|uniref:anthranilate synthase component II n=1 Tax=Agrococcus sp. Marseille-Q4369 TaxID=2810513 RepID=UPI001B8AF998|nr:gamma-glutamyl-gamma-aminobutyrate hydrolase family protein [Agrococcus sp. Marseille-Q4369]QUW18012.1 gamma-glutamyl-gamma-aminobutyrate hydrolase family protein [Agrococcus sp. Marseille-Q4369]
MTRILVVDNFDSFVYTLAGYLQELGADVSVVRNDRVDARGIAEWDAVLLSPGPGTPADAGVSIPMVHAAIDAGTPLLGVCLGHQAIAEALGAVVTHAPELMHGKTSLVEHDGSTVFEGLPSPLTATRYHSLAVVDGTVPDALRVTARTVPDADGDRAAGGVIMALEHRDAPVWGVQFHPESVLTEGGYRMLGNWLESAGLAGAAELAAGRAPLVTLASPPQR